MADLNVAVQGVEIASSILNVPMPEVYFISKEELPNGEITGIFINKDYQVVFNEDWVINSTEIEVLITCFHETRHAYQSYSIQHNINESQELLEKWDYEKNNYISPSGLNDESADYEYLSQDIEVDAIAWTHYQIKELLNLKTVIPKNIEPLINRKLKKYSIIKINQ